MDLTQLRFHSEDGGSNPTLSHQIKKAEAPDTPKRFRIEEGKFSDYSRLLEKYHYKGKHIGGNIEYHLIIRYVGKVFGGACLGRMRHEDCYEDNSLEIRRMALEPSCPKNTASYFLSKIIWWLEKNTDVPVVYTFADQTVGHDGVCYKAANFEFVRETDPSKYILWNGERYHCRSLSIDRPYSDELNEAVENGDAEIKKGEPKLLFKYKIGDRK